MKYIDEFRQSSLILNCARAIASITKNHWQIMEICGGQTHTILKYGLDRLLPASISLLHGPGCPVCITPSFTIDQAIAIAQQEGVIFCTFGDMLRVPGSKGDLALAKANGADIRTLYSPLDALTLAQSFPKSEIVFLAVGFETTAPSTALVVKKADQLGLVNFSLLCAHVLVPPAMASLLNSPQSKIQGFLAAGHVCTVTGYQAYQAIAQQYQVPIVVTGFEPADILQGIYHCIEQLEEGRFEVENCYSRSVRPYGNLQALKLIEEVFTVVDRHWRGIGQIGNSGWDLSWQYRRFDALERFNDLPIAENIDSENICGEILQGLRKPDQCPHFGIDCEPEHPLGAPMVSSEGACAAYYRYLERIG